MRKNIGGVISILGGIYNIKIDLIYTGVTYTKFILPQSALP